MASAIGDGLLGFIAGTAGGLAAGEQQKFQSQLELDRQLSLLQAQRAFAEEDRQNTIQSLGGAFPELDESEIAALSTLEGTRIASVVADRQETQREQEAAKQSNAAIQRFFDTGKITDAEQAIALEDAGINVEDQLFGDKKQRRDPAQTAAALRSLPQFANLPEEVITSLSNSPDTADSLIEDAISPKQGSVNASLLKPIRVAFPESGEVKTMTLRDAVPLIEGGTAVTGDIIETGFGEALQTSAGRFPIEDRDKPTAKEKTQRERIFDSIVGTIRKSPAAANGNFNFANPEIAKEGNLVDALRGIPDTSVGLLSKIEASNSLADFIGDSGGDNTTLKARQEMKLIKALNRRLFLAMRDGRGSNADIALADEFSVGDGPLDRLFESEESVEIVLKSNRDAALQMRRSAIRTINDPRADSNAQGTAREVLGITNDILGRLDNVFAAQKLSQMSIRHNGRPTKITKVLDTPEKVSSFILENTKPPEEGEEEGPRLNRQQVAALLFWQAQLMAKEGL